MVHVIERATEKVAVLAIDTVVRHTLRRLGLPNEPRPPKPPPPRQPPSETAIGKPKRVTRLALSGWKLRPKCPRPLTIALITPSLAGVRMNRTPMLTVREPCLKPRSRLSIARAILKLAGPAVPYA